MKINCRPIKLPTFQTVAILLYLIVITVSIYYRVNGFEFVDFDDMVYVTQNERVQSGLSLNNIKWAITSDHAANWHPLTWLSHMLDVELFGLSPGKHHLSNLFFHILNTILIYILLQQATGKMWRSAFVASLFAIHPLHVESVAWISERKDVLSTFLGFTTLWIYVLFVKTNKFKYYFLSIFFYCLGLLSKPMLVTIPCLMLLMDYWPLNRIIPKQDGNNKIRYNFLFLILEKTPFFFLSAASALVTYTIQQNWGAVASHIYPLEIRILNAFSSYINYIKLMFYPSNLSPYYSYPGNFYMSNFYINFGILLMCFFLHSQRPKNIHISCSGGYGTLVPLSL